MEELADTRGHKGFKYVPMDIVSESGESWSIADMVSGLISGKRFVLLGDYGAGKSTTTRELFLEMLKRHRKNDSSQFGIVLNLRDHHGQTNPSEALERHARDIGYPSPNHLVRAWLTGHAIVILDGFDEIATSSWSGNIQRLRDVRHHSMQLIRKFIDMTPKGSGIAITGRSFFFDNNDKELRRALGLDGRFTVLNLSDFTESQMAAYLDTQGWKLPIPAWFPSRPLLLGYLISRGLLEELGHIGNQLSPANGWDDLLARICAREAKIEAGIDGDTVRQVIERLATIARRTSDGLGPLTRQEIVHSFEHVCSFTPDDRGMVLLQRLPGLGSTKQEDGSRDFVDRDFAEAARAGDVFRFIENPFTFVIADPSTWQATLSHLGSELVAHRCRLAEFNDGKLASAVSQSSNHEGYSTLTADLVEILKELGCGYDRDLITINNMLLGDTAFGDPGQNFASVIYQSCLFQRLDLPPDADPSTLPKFRDCFFSVIEGRTSRSDLPASAFDETCIVDTFGDSSASTASIMLLPLPIGARVTLSILKKLYLQPGSGRRESALCRGLDHRARPLVTEVLQLLRKEGFTVRSATSDDTVWLPIRTESVRVRKLIAAPSTDDALLAEASRLG